MIDKANSPFYVLNEVTWRYVLKTGQIGRAIMKRIHMKENNTVYPADLLDKALALKAEYTMTQIASTQAEFTRIINFLSDSGLDYAIQRKDELFDKYVYDTSSLTTSETIELERLERLLQKPVRFV
jgi:hypothetical protein